MNNQALFHLALLTHIIGLTMMAGTTLVDYMITKQFWPQLNADRQKGLAIYNTMAKFRKLLAIGILLLIISGVTMMYTTHGVFGEQIWFRIKFGFVIVIIINGLAIGRRLGRKLGKALAEEASATNEAKLLKLKSNINTFILSQLTFFIIIFTLSAFKFN